MPRSALYTILPAPALVLQPPFYFFPALSLAAKGDLGRPKGRGPMMDSLHFLAKVVVTGYRRLGLI